MSTWDKRSLVFFLRLLGLGLLKRGRRPGTKMDLKKGEKGGNFFSLSDLMTQCYFFLIWSLCKGKALLHMYLPFKCIPTCFISKYIECSPYYVYCIFHFVKKVTMVVNTCWLVDSGDKNVKEYFGKHMM